MDFRLASDADRLTGIGWLRSLAGSRLPAANDRVRGPNASVQRPEPCPDRHRPPATAEFSAGLGADSRGPHEVDAERVACILSTIAGQGSLGCPGIWCAQRSASGSRPRGNDETLLAELAAEFAVLAISRKKSSGGGAASTGPRGRNSSCATTESKPIHRLIPKRAARPCNAALTCDGRVAAYPVFRSVAFGSAECDHRQDRIGLDAAAATGVASRGGFDPGSKLRVAALGTCRAGASSPVMFLGLVDGPAFSRRSCRSNLSEHGQSDQSPAIHHRMGPLRPGRHRLQRPLLRVLRLGHLDAVRTGAGRQTAGPGKGVRHRRHSLGRCRRALSGAGEIRRHSRDRLAGERIPPLELRRRASDFCRRRGCGRRQRDAGLGGARSGRSGQNQIAADPARSHRAFSRADARCGMDAVRRRQRMSRQLSDLRPCRCGPSPGQRLRCEGSASLPADRFWGKFNTNRNPEDAPWRSFLSVQALPPKYAA